MLQRMVLRRAAVLSASSSTSAAATSITSSLPAISSSFIHSRTLHTLLNHPTASISFTAPSSSSSSSSFLTRTSSSSFLHRSIWHPQLLLQQQRGFAGRTFGDEKKSDGPDPNAGAEGKTEQKQGEGEPVVDENSEKITGMVLILGIVLLGGYVLYEVMRERTEPHFIVRTWNWANGVAYNAAPLLPPLQVDAAGRRPRTIVLGFDQVLVKCDWTRATGWNVRKRPGVDAFIERLYLAGYELVLWSNLPQFEVEGTLTELDPLNYFKYKLYNEHTNLLDGKLVLGKDLNRLDRDPKRLIVIEVENSRFPFQPIGDYDNLLTVKPFTDDVADNELKKLTILLEDAKRFNVHDVTQLLKKYKEHPDQDPFAQEKEKAREAERLLKAGKGGGREKKEKSSASAKEAKQETKEEEKKQGWGSWLKSKVSSK